MPHLRLLSRQVGYRSGSGRVNHNSLSNGFRHPCLRLAVEMLPKQQYISGFAAISLIGCKTAFRFSPPSCPFADKKKDARKKTSPIFRTPSPSIEYGQDTRYHHRCRRLSARIRAEQRRTGIHGRYHRRMDNDTHRHQGTPFAQPRRSWHKLYGAKSREATADQDQHTPRRSGLRHRSHHYPRL